MPRLRDSRLEVRITSPDLLEIVTHAEWDWLERVADLLPKLPGGMDLVRDLVARSQAIMLDLSRPTENVMWEIGLRDASDKRRVFTCHKDWLDTLATPSLSAVGSPRHHLPLCSPRSKQK